MIRAEHSAHLAMAAPIETRAALRASFAAIKPAPVRTVRRAPSRALHALAGLCLAAVAVGLAAL